MERRSARTATTTRASTAAPRRRIGRSSARQANAGAVALVRNSTNAGSPAGCPGSPFDNHRSGGGPSDCTTRTPARSSRPSGRRRVLKTGVFTTLRLDDPQANQTLQCDPDYAQGQEFSAFQYGCKPWYGANTFTNGTWWNTTHEAVPRRRPLVLVQHACRRRSARTPPPTPGGASSPHRACRPDRSATTSPSRPRTATTSTTTRASSSPATTTATTTASHGDPNGWVQQGGDSRYPRVVNLFIVPYQARQGADRRG